MYVWTASIGESPVHELCRLLDRQFAGWARPVHWRDIARQYILKSHHTIPTMVLNSTIIAVPPPGPRATGLRHPEMSDSTTQRYLRPRESTRVTAPNVLPPVVKTKS